MTSRTKKEDGGVWVNGIYVEERNFAAIEAAMRISKTVRPTNVLVVGPSGYGKTSIAEAAAAKHGLAFLRMNCAQVRDPEEWFGYREARQGSTEFVRSKLVDVITAGNAVVCLDEFNRVEPWLSNTLYPLLDHDRRTTIHNEDFVVGKNVTFFATINQGYQYVGTFVLDAAIANRMDIVLSVNALPHAVEAQLLRARTGCESKEANMIASMMGKIRATCDSKRIMADMSTRTSLKIALMVASGKLSLKDSLWATVVNALASDDAKIVADSVAEMLVKHENDRSEATKK